MPDLIIALVRHGDYHQPVGVPSALLPYALTEQGAIQAADAALELEAFATERELTIDSVLHASRQQRAWQTARIIATKLGEGYAVSEFAELSERSVGAVANLTVAQIEQILLDDPRYEVPPDGWKSDSHYCLPFQGAESLVQAGERVAKHIKQVAMDTDSNKARLKIIVGHGAAIRHACAALKILDLEMVRSISMFHAKPVYIGVESGVWQHLAGEWKSRKSHGDGDEIRER